MFFTRGLDVDDPIPAKEWAHASPFIASSAEALDTVVSLRCYRYNVMWMGLIGITGSLCSAAHNFHLWNAHKYFLAVERALLNKAVDGRAVASFCSSRFCRSLIESHSPVASTSAKKERKNMV